MGGSASMGADHADGGFEAAVYHVTWAATRSRYPSQRQHRGISRMLSAADQAPKAINSTTCAWRYR